MLNNKIKKSLRPLFLHLCEFECSFLSKRIKNAYRRLYGVVWRWGGANSTPEFFDHSMDLFYFWQERRLPYWLERGVYGLQALKMFEKPIVLELGCGDGFNARNFYSSSAVKITACDFDKDAIKVAKKKNSCINVTYILADIRNQMPDNENYTNIVWDASIEHFTPDEIHGIMEQIKLRLKETGILSGHTIVERLDGKKSLHQHEYEFKDMNDLGSFLKPYFKNIFIFETIYSDRHNLYYYASDGILPFSDGWKHSLRIEKN